MIFCDDGSNGAACINRVLDAVFKRFYLEYKKELVDSNVDLIDLLKSYLNSLLVTNDDFMSSKKDLEGLEEKELNVDFVLVTSTKGICFNPHKEKGLEFTPKTEPNSRYVLRPIDPEEDACGNRLGLECKLFTTYSISKEIFEFVDSYNNSSQILRVADDVSLPFKYQEEILIDEDGKFKTGYHPRRYLCPSDINILINSVESELIQKTNQFLKLLRWRQGFDAPGEIIETPSLYWKVGEGDYPLVPMEGNPKDLFIVDMLKGIHWDEEDDKNLQNIYQKKGVSEPLGHTLLREGFNLFSESPKSAILIMTAALETGVKMHISNIAPDTGWLMEKAPSPPIFKILRDYIPLIHNKQKNQLTYWDKVKPYINKARDLIELRNKVAHTGHIPEGSGSVKNYLVLVSDLLYLLDVLEGHEWAKSRISHKLRKDLDWPVSKHEQGTLIISEPY